MPLKEIQNETHFSLHRRAVQISILRQLWDSPSFCGAAPMHIHKVRKLDRRRRA